MRILLLSLAASSMMLAQNIPAADPSALAPMTAGEKLEYHVAKVYSPFSLLESGFQAAILQWNDDPREWHEGYYGLWRRAASTVGYDTIRNTFMFTLDSIGGQDPRYFRSGSGAPLSRAGYSIRQTFVGHSDSGKKTLPWMRFAATYGVAFLANSWNPDRLSDNRHAVVRGTVTLAADAGNNLFDEFWPDIKKVLRHKKASHPKELRL